MTQPAVRPASSLARRGAAALALSAVLLLGGCAAEQPAAAPRPPVVATPSASPTPSAPAPEPLPVGRPPASVVIPAIGLEEPLIDLGIQADGSMQVPTDFDDVGWFTGGGKPGGVGPTVIAAHVDSASGPAVFYDLKKLVPGDTVQVTDVSGRVFDYVVTGAGDYSKSDFPTAEVFGALPTDELRLITCTGLFDRAVGHYEDNRVVFATRA